jgi:hypothetical protein
LLPSAGQLTFISGVEEHAGTLSTSRIHDRSEANLSLWESLHLFGEKLERKHA